MIVSAATAAALNFKIIYYTNILECEVRFKKSSRIHNLWKTRIISETSRLKSYLLCYDDKYMYEYCVCINHMKIYTILLVC